MCTDALKKPVTSQTFNVSSRIGLKGKEGRMDVWHGKPRLKEKEPGEREWGTVTWTVSKKVYKKPCSPLPAYPCRSRKPELQLLTSCSGWLVIGENFVIEALRSGLVSLLSHVSSRCPLAYLPAGRSRRLFNHFGLLKILSNQPLQISRLCFDLLATFCDTKLCLLF